MVTMGSTPPTTTLGRTEPAARSERSRPFAPVFVLVVGLVITGLLAWICWTVNDRNETRLLRIQVQEGGTVLAAAVPSIEAPLASAVDIAQATGGDPAKFTTYMGPFVGSGRVYASVSLLALGTTTPRPLAVLGQPPFVSTASNRFAAALAHAQRTGGPGVIGILGTTQRRIGYVFAGPGSSFGVYAETALPSRQRVDVASNAAFSDLDFAIYLGRVPVARQLLGANDTAALPLTGRTASTVVPVGDNALLIVAKPAGQLGGGLLNNLAWIVALAGLALTLLATWVAVRLVRGRRLAEQLAVMNEALYGQQRSIAQTLQRALQPAALPPVAGLETGVRYRTGVEGIDVGGDWCDLVELGPSRVLIVVGDVFGRGLGAATTMAALHYAIRAYAREGDAPSAILSKLSALARLEGDGRFASVLCGIVDVEGHRLTLANAGHLPPLLVADGRREFMDVAPGPPIGAENGRGYDEVTLDVPTMATVLAFTDGLVERRGEIIDRGLERLRDSVPATLVPLDGFLDGLLVSLTPSGSRDDTAVLGVRWTT